MKRLEFKEWAWRPQYWDTDREKCHRGERLHDKEFKRRLRWEWDQLSYCERFPLSTFAIKCRIACEKGKLRKIQLP